MSRDGLPRAYLRIDPNIDQVYPELRSTFVGLMCSGHRQPARGRYRDRKLVEALHGRPFVRKCYERGDLVDLPDGRVYIDGWDEWQEGDQTVADRMRRLRDRRKSKRHPVTVSPSLDRNDVTTDAGSTNSIGTSLGVGVGVEPPNPPPSGGLRAHGRSPRQIAAAQREVERQERDRRKAAVQALNLAYYRGEITEADLAHEMAELGQVPA